MAPTSMSNELELEREHHLEHEHEHELELELELEHEHELEELIVRAKSCILKAIQKYGIEGIALSFNGGKDCTVMLHLFCSTLPPPPIKRWPVCYIASERPFYQVEEFIDSCEQRYPIKIYRYEGEMREGVDNFVKNVPSLKAILIGVRRTDPHCSQLDTFAQTDDGWPPLTRIHPLLDWSYSQIWSYLIHNKVPYCSLYDQGYTSLGSVNQTIPNPYLHKPGLPGHYYPAFELVDESQERAGRIL